MAELDRVLTRGERAVAGVDRLSALASPFTRARAGGVRRWPQGAARREPRGAQGGPRRRGRDHALERQAHSAEHLTLTVHPEIFWALADVRLRRRNHARAEQPDVDDIGREIRLGAHPAPLAGVILGFGLMIAVVGLGLDILFQRFPQILPIMRIAGSIYMIWLALKIALAKPMGEVEAGGRPIGFLAAAGFQWVNPKAWVMALSALAAYAGVVDGYTKQRPFHRRALRLDRNPVQRRLDGVRRFAQPPAQGSPGDPAVQLDDGGVAGRLDRADPVRIGLRRARRPRRASPSPLPAGAGCAPARATFRGRPKQSSAVRPARIRHRCIFLSGV